MIRFRHLVFVLVALLLLGGCGATRRSVKSDVETVSNTQTDTHTESEEAVTEQTDTTTDLAKDEEVTTEVTEFDTSLPVDPATGTPPVKRRSTQTRRTTTQARQETASEHQSVARQNTDSSADERSEAIVVTETDDRRGMNSVQRTLCTVGIVAIVLLVLWLLRRHFKR